MKTTDWTKTRAAIQISAAIVALALGGVSHAQVREPPKPGTYYSAKDFEWSPPWPFNPHPELEAVEIAPGIFVFDDTAIPDTPEQAAARAAHQAAVEHAKALAANPALQRRNARRGRRHRRRLGRQPSWQSLRLGLSRTSVTRSATQRRLPVLRKRVRPRCSSWASKPPETPKPPRSKWQRSRGRIPSACPSRGRTRRGDGTSLTGSAPKARPTSNTHTTWVLRSPSGRPTSGPAGHWGLD